MIISVNSDNCFNTELRELMSDIVHIYGEKIYSYNDDIIEFLGQTSSAEETAKRDEYIHGQLKITSLLISVLKF